MGKAHWVKVRLSREKLISLLEQMGDEEIEVQIRQNTEKDSPRVGAVHALSGEHEDRLLKDVSAAAQQAWLAAYKSPEWIRQEMLKAYAWIEANPRKRPKSFARFFGSWLTRAWEKERKQIPSIRPDGPKGQMFK